MKSFLPLLVLIYCTAFVTVGARPTFDVIAEALVNAMTGERGGYPSGTHHHYHGGYDQGNYQSGGNGGFYEEQGYGYGQQYPRPPLQQTGYYPPPGPYGQQSANGYNGGYPGGGGAYHAGGGGYHGGSGGYPGHVTIGGDYTYGQHRPHGYKQHGY